MVSDKEKHDRGFVAWAKILLDDVLLITGIRLFEFKTPDGKLDRQIRFPSRRIPVHLTDGEFVNVAICNTNDEEFRQHIIDCVFAAWDSHPRNPKNKTWKKKQTHSDDSF